jgi:hypothetical protein
MSRLLAGLLGIVFVAAGVVSLAEGASGRGLVGAALTAGLGGLFLIYAITGDRRLFALFKRK